MTQIEETKRMNEFKLISVSNGLSCVSVTDQSLVSA